MGRPSMADGRMFTSYTSNGQLNNTLQSNALQGNNIDYKNYIQNNAASVINLFTSTKYSDV